MKVPQKNTLSCDELRTEVESCAELSRIFGDAKRNSATYMSFLGLLKDSLKSKK